MALRPLLAQAWVLAWKNVAAEPFLWVEQGRDWRGLSCLTARCRRVATSESAPCDFALRGIAQLPHPEAVCSLPRGPKCDASYPHEIVPSVPRFQHRAWRSCPVVVLLGVAIVESLQGSNHWPLVGHTPPLSLSQVVAAMAASDFQPLE